MLPRHLLTLLFIFFLVLQTAFCEDTAGASSWQAFTGPGAGIANLAFDPSNNQIMYAVTVQSGVHTLHKSEDGGDSWISLSSLPLKVITTFTVDPINVGVVYVGGISATGVGVPVVCKSVDAGISWTEGTSGLTGGSIYAIAIDPSNTQNLFAATDSSINGGGIYKSVDGGSSWILLASALLAEPNFPSNAARSLFVAPDNSQMLYASDGMQQMQKSVNGGTSWSSWFHVLVQGVFADLHTMVFDPNDSNIIYAATNFGVFKSVDAGTSWTQQNQGLTSSYTDTIAIDPTDSKVLYAGTNGGGLFKSIDTAISWSPINSGLVNSTTSATHFLSVDPANNQIVYAVTGYGTFKFIHEAACGLSHGTSLITQPTINLCLEGTPTTVSGTGPWTWICNSSTSSAVSSCSTALARPTVYLPQTGQTGCWDDSGNTISCTDTGQDGEIKAGLAWPTPRFRDNSDQTMTDNLTGLVWLKDANLIKTRDPSFDADYTEKDGAVYWQHALDYIKKLNEEKYLGYSDWRLPNINEINSLVNYAQGSPGEWLISEGFINVEPNTYFSSTTAPRYDGYFSESIYVVPMNYDNASNTGALSKRISAGFAWPVRSTALTKLPTTGQLKCYDASGEVTCTNSGQDGETQAGVAWPSIRLNYNADQTISDNLTGLLWSKNANPAVTAKTWQESLDSIKYLNSNNYLGKSDWRLPNINELKSLMHRGVGNSAAWLSSMGADNVQVSYWSSSGYTRSSTSAIQADLQSGTSSADNKINKHYVWPVSGGIYGLLSLFPSPDNFATTVLGSQSAPLIFTITNSGAAAITVSSIILTGADADQYSVFPGGITSCNSLAPTLAAGTSCTIAVTFSPTSIGIKSATLQVASNDVVNPSITTTLTGTGVAVVNGSCGSSNIAILTSAPITNLCTSGSASTVSGTGPWSWSCDGVYGGTTANCTAQIASYTVTAIAGSGGSISPASISINHGSTTSFTVTADAGKNISTITGCSGILSDSIYNTGAITTACTVTALFGTIQYAINANVSGGNGTVTCTNPVDHGANATCTVTPSSDYRIATFTDNGSDNKANISDNSYSINNVTASHTITVTFEIIPDTTPPTVAITTPVNGSSGNILYEITGTATDDNTVNTVEVQIYNGVFYLSIAGTATATPTWIPATTTDNWQTWLLDTANFTFMNTTDGTYTITARAVDGFGNLATPSVVSFIRGSIYILTVSMSGSGQGTVSNTHINCISGGSTVGCSASYPGGSEISLTATPQDISTFTGWSGDCTGSTCSLTMNSTKDVTASFSLAPKAKIENGNSFSSLAEAYENASNNDMIQLLEDVLPFSTNITKVLTLKGGYRSDFNRTANGYTTLQGTLIIANDGSLVIDRVVVK